MPRDDQLPHLRGAPEQTAAYRSPRFPGRRRGAVPERSPVDHAQWLRSQLEGLATAISERSAERAAAAKGELVTIEPAQESSLRVDSLSDSRTEAMVVAVNKDESALVHYRRGDLKSLGRKIDQYGDPERRTRTGRPRNEPLVASIETLRLATLQDLSDGFLTHENVIEDRTYWLELWTYGGTLAPAEERARVISEMQWLHANLGLTVHPLRRFEGVERDIYLLVMSGERLKLLPYVATDIYRVRELSAGIRDFRVWESQETVIDVEVTSPDDDATAVVLLDTGSSPEHPLLSAVYTDDGESVVPGDTSPVDSHGHGTQMAGIAAFTDLGADLASGGPVDVRSLIRSVRLLPHDGFDEENRDLWPERTREAVLAGEDSNASRLVFNLSVGAGNPLGGRTSWSMGMDLLAFNEGKGRLMFAAAGNVNDLPDSDTYPVVNLGSYLDDPAQAENVITVAAITHRIEIPPDPIFGTSRPLAPSGGLSPHSVSGLGGDPIKPDIVMEGGNIAVGGPLSPDDSIESLTLLTCSRRHAEGRPLTFTAATSAAAAGASGLGAAVWSVNPTLRPATIRALVVHSARHSPTMQQQFPDKTDRLRACGYGEPDVMGASYSWRERPTILVESELRPRYQDDQGLRREHHLIRLPLPEEQLMALGEQEVELSVTLSFFGEPNEVEGVRTYFGARLGWDLQRSNESENEFGQRINKLARDHNYEPPGGAYPWLVGPRARGRGTVQSDRCSVPAAALAGDKLIAVYPVLGWWDRRLERSDTEIQYSLIVSIDAGDADVDLYTPIENFVTVQV